MQAAAVPPASWQARAVRANPCLRARSNSARTFGRQVLLLSGNCTAPEPLHPSPFVSGGRFWLWGVYVQLFLSIASTSSCIACEFRLPVCTYKFQLLRQPQALTTIAALNAQPSHTERSLKQAPTSAALTARQLLADSRALQNTHSAFPRARQPWKPSNSNPKFSPHDRNPRCKTSMSVCLRQSFATMSQPSF